jgi:hypothetical protein
MTDYLIVNQQPVLIAANGLINSTATTKVAGASYIVDSNVGILDYDLLIDHAGAVALSIPMASLTQGRNLVVTDSGGNASPTSAIVITPGAGQTINGASTYQLNTPRASIRLVGDLANGNWVVTATGDGTPV